MTSYLAEMTQDQVFKSISDNVSNGGGIDLNNRTLLAIALGIAGLVMLIFLFSLRGKRAAVPRAVNHSGRLLKEIMKQIPLKPAELKQLKILAQSESGNGNAVESPLTFLLCPSAFAAAMRSDRAKVDRKVMAGLAKKMGLTAAAKPAKRR